MNETQPGGTQSDGRDDALLKRYGYEQVYERTISRFASFAFAFSFISIATGIFTTYGYVLQTGGPMGIWTWGSSPESAGAPSRSSSRPWRRAYRSPDTPTSGPRGSPTPPWDGCWAGSPSPFFRSS